MKNRKYLSEQVGTNNPCSPYNGSLRIACESNCLPSFVQPKNYKDQIIASGLSPKTKKYLIITNDKKPGGLRLQYFSDEYLTPTDEKVLLCDQLERIENAQAGPEIDQVLMQIKNYLGNDKIMSYKEGMDFTGGTIAKGWTMTKIQDLQGYEQFKPIADQILGDRTIPVYVWYKQGMRQASVDQTEKWVKYYEDLGYIQGQAPAEGGYKQIDLVKELAGRQNVKFQTSTFYMYKDITYASDKQLRDELSKANTGVKTGETKSTCITFMNTYEIAADRNLDISQQLLDDYKISFNNCLTRFKFPFKKKMIDKLRKKRSTGTLAGNTLDYNIDLGSPKGGTPLNYGVTRESVDNRIKNILRESLSEIKQLKKKSLTEERVLSNKGFSLLFEQFSNKKRLNEDVFFEALFKEINSQRRQGLSDKIIEEQLFDSIKNMPWFGGVLSGLKEMLVKWIINKFVPGGEETQIGQFITVALANLEFSEIPKLLTNCKSLTEWLTKSIIESMLVKFAESKGVSGGIADVIRNTIVDTIDSSQFYDTMEDKLSGVICSAFGGLKSKVQDIAQSGEETAQGNA